MKAIYYHYLALWGYFGLFTLLMLWNTLLAPSKHFPVAMVLLVHVTPLLLPLRGFLNANSKTCAWTAYISMLYFVHGIEEAYVNLQERQLAYLEIILSLILFLGTTLYVRFNAREKK